MSLKRNKLQRSIFSVTGILLLSKLLGFAKQMVTASVFGATIETDLINLSEGFIGNIKYVIVQTLLTSFVAVYIHEKEREPAAAEGFAVSVGKAFTLIAAAIAAVVMLLAPAIARIIAPTYDTQLSLRLAGYLRLFAPVLVLFVWIAVFHALLDANKRFVPGQLEGLNQSVITMLLILLLTPVFGVQTLVLAFLAQTIWNVLFLCVVSRTHWRYQSGNPFRDPAVRELLKMIAPLLLGYAMIYINQQVDKILVSGLEPGTVTAMGYAAVLSNLVSTFIVSFASILFPYITTQISRGNHDEAAVLTLRTMLLMTVVFLPISILTILCAQDVVAIAFGRGAFDANSVSVAASALAGYAFSFVPLIMREVFSRLQYGYQDSKQPMINSTIGIMVNIALSIALCPKMGVLGVTFASSVSVFVCGSLNMYSAHKHNGHLYYRQFLNNLPVLFLSGAVCVMTALWGLSFWHGQSPFVRFLLVTATSAGAYMTVVSPLLWKLLRKRP